eukprot:gene4707-5761_t
MLIGPQPLACPALRAASATEGGSAGPEEDPGGAILGLVSGSGLQELGAQYHTPEGKTGELNIPQESAATGEKPAWRAQLAETYAQVKAMPSSALKLLRTNYGAAAASGAATATSARSDPSLRSSVLSVGGSSEGLSSSLTDITEEYSSPEVAAPLESSASGRFSIASVGGAELGESASPGAGTLEQCWQETPDDVRRWGDSSGERVGPCALQASTLFGYDTPRSARMSKRRDSWVTWPASDGAVVKDEAYRHGEEGDRNVSSAGNSAGRTETPNASGTVLKRLRSEYSSPTEAQRGDVEVLPAEVQVQQSLTGALTNFVSGYHTPAGLNNSATSRATERRVLEYDSAVARVPTMRDAEKSRSPGWNSVMLQYHTPATTAPPPTQISVDGNSTPWIKVLPLCDAQEIDVVPKDVTPVQGPTQREVLTEKGSPTCGWTPGDVDGSAVTPRDGLGQGAVSMPGRATPATSLAPGAVVTLDHAEEDGVMEEDRSDPGEISPRCLFEDTAPSSGKSEDTHMTARSGGSGERGGQKGSGCS